MSIRYLHKNPGGFFLIADGKLLLHDAGIVGPQ